MIELLKTTIIFLVVSFLLNGCDNPVGNPVENQSEAVSQAGEKSSQPVGDKAFVQLVPDPLKATDSAQARIFGCSGNIRYAWSVNSRKIEGASLAALSNNHYRMGDKVTVTLFCNGGKHQASTTVVNGPPQVLGASFREHSIKGGRDLELVPDVFDPEGDDVQFDVQWQIDGEVLAYETELVLPGDYIEKGQTISARITPHDFYAEGPVYRSLDFHVPNAAPYFTSKPPEEFYSLTYNYEIEAVDPDGEPLAFRLEEGPPAMSIEQASKRLIWQIEPGTTGTFPVRIIAEDPEGDYAEQVFELTLNMRE